MPLSKIVANSITDDTITTDQIADTSVHGRRNLIINGAMQVAQRGTSSTSDSYRTVDRTRTNHGGASVTQTQQTLSSGSPYDEGFRHFYRVANTAVSSATSANMQMFQFIEAQNIASSGWQYTSSSNYVTFSAWVRSSLAGTYMFRLRSFDGTSQNYASKFTLAADTWTKITKTVPGNSNLQFDNNAERGLEVNITVHFGTDFTSSSFVDDAWAAFDGSSRSDDFDQNWCNTASATFDTTGWQLEVGDKATPFEHRSFSQEELDCYRYYFAYAGTHVSGEEKNWLYNIDDNDSYRRGQHQFPVPMRGTPAITVTFVGTPGTARGAQHINSLQTNTFVNSEASYAYYSNLVADAEL